jgi:hypothetical protein
MLCRGLTEIRKPSANNVALRRCGLQRAFLFSEVLIGGIKYVGNATGFN